METSVFEVKDEEEEEDNWELPDRDIVFEAASIPMSSVGQMLCAFE